MHHCPYCGTKFKEDEFYCMSCGKQLPQDLHERLESHRVFNKLWYIPIALLAVFLLASGTYYIFLQNQTADAKALYNKAEDMTMDGNYAKAKNLLQSALDNYEDFNQADIALSYVKKALHIENSLQQASEHLERQEFQEALTLINQAEKELKNYNGDAVKQLISKITAHRNTAKTEELKYKLEQNPSIDELKTLVWEAEAIKTEAGKKITLNIRNQIVDYTYTKASEQLNDKQFTDALLIVEDGLNYAPDSDKLHSLQTTIEKEKTAFETAQRQRIEQAISLAEKERKMNENDAIELVSVDVSSNEQGKLVVKGKVKSVATIPINTILVEYSLLTKTGTEFLTNKVYVYPDTLYPEETGDFEFTHFDIDQEGKDISIKVNKIKWYTDQ